jgi:arylsulfatase A-like enzyme
LKFYKSILCCGLFCNLLGFSSAALGDSANSTKPNLVIILADDMGYGDSSICGGWLKTPALERLAAEGLRFTDFHASANVCSPTRAGLLTGRYQQRAGIPQVILADPKSPTHFVGLQSSVEVTLPELLKQAGYATALIGKWHLGYYPQYNPIHFGFDEFRGYLSGNVDYQVHVDQEGRPDWWDGLQLKPETGYTTHLITQHAEEFIKSHRNQPFFLYMAEEPVHAPYQGPNDPPVRGGFSDEALPNDPSLRDKQRDKGRPVKDIYRDMMTEMDNGIASVIATLQETGLATNTLVFFFSDNGAPRGPGSNLPLRGFKGSDWEGGHHEPAVAWWPGHIKPGVTDQMANSLDVMPTFLDLAGISAPKKRPLDGVSLKSLLFDQKPLGPRQFFWDGAMRDGTWKLMVRQGNGRQGKLAKPELFDLANDLSEKQDVSDQYPDRVQTMLAAWTQWKKDVATGATPQPGPTDLVK